MENQKIETRLLNGYDSAVRGALEASATFIGALRQVPALPFSAYSPVEYWDSSASLLAAGFGAAVSGKRSFCMIDTLSQNQLSAYSLCGVNGALVLLYVEDTAYLKWDSRLIFKSAHFPVLEPSDSADIKRYVKIAFNLSEKYDVPVVVRATTALLRSSSLVDLYTPKDIADKKYRKDTSKYLLTSSTVQLCEDDVRERDRRLQKDCETFPIHEKLEGDSGVGVIACGEEARLAKEALPKASVLKLGTSNPLPIECIRAFASSVKKLYVIEERPYLEYALFACGISCIGASAFPREGRKSVQDIAGYLASGETFVDNGLPVRVPDFCNDCPLVSFFLHLQAGERPVFADYGCTTLGGSFLGRAEISLPHVLPTAIAFARSKPCVCVIPAHKLYEYADCLPMLTPAVRLVVLEGRGTDAVSLLRKADIAPEAVTMEEWTKAGEGMLDSFSVIVINGLRCKYEA